VGQNGQRTTVPVAGAFFIEGGKPVSDDFFRLRIRRVGEGQDRLVAVVTAFLHPLLPRC
jgi:hypothetical protein